MNELRTQLQQTYIGGILYFFTLQYTLDGQDIEWHFHCNGMIDSLDVENNRIVSTPIMTYDGVDHRFVGIAVEGLKLSDGGKVNSPKLKVSNTVDGTQGFISILCRMYDDLRGAKLRVRQTTATAYQLGTGQYMEQIWYIERKTSETVQAVEFELKSPLDFRRATIPTRVISPYCAWAMRGQYRGEICGYTGTAYFDADGNPVDTLDKDECGGKCSDCELRFGKGSRLPFGGQLVTYSNGNW